MSYIDPETKKQVIESILEAYFQFWEIPFGRPAHLEYKALSVAISFQEFLGPTGERISISSQKELDEYHTAAIRMLSIEFKEDMLAQRLPKGVWKEQEFITLEPIAWMYLFSEKAVKVSMASTRRYRKIKKSIDAIVVALEEIRGQFPKITDSPDWPSLHLRIEENILVFIQEIHYALLDEEERRTADIRAFDHIDKHR